jgi:hypothetical protein
MRRRLCGSRFGLLSVLAAAPVGAATLPAHGPLKVLVISDEVNPHNLSDADLTQRGDISAALNAPDSGLKLDGDATEVYSQCIDEALTALNSAAPPQVVVYFAHRPALGCDQSAQQTALTSAFESQLMRGGGIVVFHHGGYTWQGKEGVLPLLGVNASGTITWDTTVGQRVFNVAPGHFVTSNGVTYEGRGALTGTGDVPAGMFDYFDNIPDERYPSTALLKEAGETRTVLFASDSGGTRVLGYALERAGWQGRIVFYQPAEYQPHALDDRAGPNFQILANAIVYSAHQEGGSGGGGGSNSGGAPMSNGGNASTGGAQPGGGGAGAGADGARAGAPDGGAQPGGGASSAGGANGGALSAGPTQTAGAATAGSPAGTPGSTDSGDCGCKLATSGTRLTTAGTCLASLAIGLSWLRRRARPRRLLRP